MAKQTTREKILDAAEILFAEKGFSTTSVREITRKAGVNLAALNYYFGSKAGLIEAVFKRRIDPINRDRLEMLRKFEAEAQDKPLSLEKILEAFLLPAFRMSDESQPARIFINLMGRIHMEASSLDSGNEEINRTKNNIMMNFKDVFIIFSGMLAKALPGVSREELFWRLSFTLGSMAHTMMLVHGKHSNPVTEALSALERSEPLSPGNQDKVLSYLVRYTAAGLRG